MDLRSEDEILGRLRRRKSEKGWNKQEKGTIGVETRLFIKRKEEREREGSRTQRKGTRDTQRLKGHRKSVVIYSGRVFRAETQNRLLWGGSVRDRVMRQT